MNKLRIEIRLVSEADDKQLFAARVPVESIDQAARMHGRDAVVKMIMEMFDRVTQSIRK